MKTEIRVFVFLEMLLLAVCPVVYAGHGVQSTFSETSKIKYVYSMEEAQRLADQQKKLIFCNCYARWANPCIGMDKFVFSDSDFAGYMNDTFVNLFIDMKSEEGKTLAKKYGIRSFAYYLILDSKGEVVQRISGGGALPEFANRVKVALSPKTSLAGTQKKYESGKYSKKDLYNYLYALNVAGSDSLFSILGKEYMSLLSEREYSEKKNWIFARLYRNRDCNYYRYLIKHKTDFVASNGTKAVDNYLSSLFSSEVLGYATGDTEYSVERMAKLKEEMKEALLPDTCIVAVVCQVGQLRGERKYHELLQYMEQSAHYFNQQMGVRSLVESSFNFPNLSSDVKEELIAYLEKAALRPTDSEPGKLNKLITLIKEGYKGITFEHGSFCEVLQKAKEKHKLVFIDFYTSWCGPCRVMANSVFPREDVGEFFNVRFVSLKVDAEKGEGVDLAKRYQVQGFPTMLFLDSDGNVLSSLLGSKAPDVFIKEATKAYESITVH